MLADTDWSALTLAGAFVGGLVVGGVAVIRVTRYVLEYLRRDQHRDD